MTPIRSFAIVPAAGRSVRMGCPKLLLPWRGTTVIQHVLATWKASRIWRVVVIVRPGDDDLETVCRNADVDVVVPVTAPPEMKVSIEHGLRHVEQTYGPTANDVWLLAPGDIPEICASTIDQLLTSHRDRSPAIAVPTHEGRRGHPVLFRWPLAREVSGLADDEGVNVLLRRYPVHEVVCSGAGVQDDLDTPDDYRRLQDHETLP